MRRTDPTARIAALRAQLATQAGAAVGAGPRTPLGLAAIDHALGGGLPTAAVHDVCETAPAAATAFAALWLARRGAESRGPLIWIETPARGVDRPYGPGLARFGVDMARLILLRPRDAKDALWAFEESLRAGAAAVAAELEVLPPIAGRRLQLAAEAGGAMGFALRRRANNAAGAASTASGWRVTAARADGAGRPRWVWALRRARNGASGQWEVMWDDATDRLSLAAPLRDGLGVSRAGMG